MSLLSRIGLAPRPRPGPLDLAAPEVAIDPYPHYEALRRDGPVHYLPAHNAWIVLGFGEVKAAFAQPHSLSNAPYAEVDGVLLAAGPPDHEAVRKLVSPRFTPARLDGLAAFAHERAFRLAKPELDAVEDYAGPLSRAVAARLIGFDDAALADLVAATAQSMAAPDPLAALIASLDSLAPRADLFAGLAAAAGDGPARSLVRLLWLAATMTTERVITRAVLRLLEQPDLRVAVAADRALLPLFVDEVMRLHPPELMVPRLTREQVALGGRDIPAGSLVHLCIAAANRDPFMFEAPSELRLDRRSQRHFTFGSGIHHCVGAPLARRVVAAAIAALVGPGRDLRAAEPLGAIPWFLTMTACAPTRLRIAL